MNDQPGAQERSPDGAEMAREMADIARRTQRLVADFVARQSALGPIGNADPLNISSAFLEMTRRRGDFAIVGLAAVARGGKMRLGVGGIADRPAVRDWDGLDGDALDDALNAFAWELGGTDDIHATARYRREMVRTLGRRAIEQARDACRS